MIPHENSGLRVSASDSLQGLERLNIQPKQQMPRRSVTTYRPHLLMGIRSTTSYTFYILCKLHLQHKTLPQYFQGCNPHHMLLHDFCSTATLHYTSVLLQRMTIKSRVLLSAVKCYVKCFICISGIRTLNLAVQSSFVTMFDNVAVANWPHK